jgi:hypothetical protein
MNPNDLLNPTHPLSPLNPVYQSSTDVGQNPPDTVQLWIIVGVYGAVTLSIIVMIF